MCGGVEDRRDTKKWLEAGLKWQQDCFQAFWSQNSITWQSKSFCGVAKSLSYYWCCLWTLVPLSNPGSHFLTVTMEFELDFKLKSPVFTKKVWRHWTLAQTAERKSGKWLGSSSYSFTLWRSGFRKHILEHRRRHRWRRFCILHIIGPRSHVNSTRWQSLWDMLDTAKATRRVAQGDRASEDMENITDDTQNCWRNAHRSGPLSPNKLQQYLSGLCMVNWAEFEFRPSIKKHHVHETIFFSYQFDLWHHLKYICCRVASVAKPPWV